MQGIFVNGQRPRSKKEIKEAVAANPGSVAIEATSMFGNEYGGPSDQAPEGQTVYFVGPDPYTARNFYGQITRKGDKVTIR